MVHHHNCHFYKHQTVQVHLQTHPLRQIQRTKKKKKVEQIMKLQNFFEHMVICRMSALKKTEK